MRQVAPATRPLKRLVCRFRGHQLPITITAASCTGVSNISTMVGCTRCGAWVEFQGTVNCPTSNYSHRAERVS